LLPLLPLLACTVSANVGDLGGGGVLDAADDSSSANDGGTEPRLDSSPANDAGADGDPVPLDAGCGVSFPQRGSFIDVGIVQGPTPSLSGGNIVPGLYELTAMRVYFDGSQSGTMRVRETMRVRGSAAAGAFDRLTEARDATGSFQAYPLHGETLTYEKAAGPGIWLTPECPTKDFQTSNRFDMKGDTLILFDDLEFVERVYRRVE
jgi:hypothetical protein